MQQIQAFKREQSLDPAAEGETPVAAGDLDEEIDLRAEDDALIAAELEAAAAEQAKEPETAEDEGERPARRRRGRRGGRRTGRPKPSEALEATFDHGDEGYGLWLDPAVQDDPVYAEYWAGHRPVVVSIEEEQIVIRRSNGDDGDDSE